MIISSHVLHEVDKISDQVVLMSYGYVIAEGQIHGVRSEVKEHPMQILVRCTAPGLLASKLFSQDHVVEAKLNQDGRGVLVRTRDAEQFYLLLNRVIAEEQIDLEAVAPADDDVKLPDPVELSKIMTRIAEQSQHLVSEFLTRQATPDLNTDPLNIGQAFFDMTARLMTNPAKLVQV